MRVTVRVADGHDAILTHDNRVNVRRIARLGRLRIARRKFVRVKRLAALAGRKHLARCFAVIRRASVGRQVVHFRFRGLVLVHGVLLCPRSLQRLLVSLACLSLDGGMNRTGEPDILRAQFLAEIRRGALVQRFLQPLFIRQHVDLGRLCRHQRLRIRRNRDGGKLPQLLIADPVSPHAAILKRLSGNRHEPRRNRVEIPARVEAKHRVAECVGLRVRELRHRHQRAVANLHAQRLCNRRLPRVMRPEDHRIAHVLLSPPAARLDDVPVAIPRRSGHDKLDGARGLVHRLALGDEEFSHPANAAPCAAVHDIRHHATMIPVAVVPVAQIRAARIG